MKKLFLMVSLFAVMIFSSFVIANGQIQGDEKFSSLLDTAPKTEKLIVGGSVINLDEYLTVAGSNMSLSISASNRPQGDVRETLKTFTPAVSFNIERRLTSELGEHFGYDGNLFVLFNRNSASELGFNNNQVSGGAAIRLYPTGSHGYLRAGVISSFTEHSVQPVIGAGYEISRESFDVVPQFNYRFRGTGLSESINAGADVYLKSEKSYGLKLGLSVSNESFRQSASVQDFARASRFTASAGVYWSFWR
jgi:hypothetical protein